MSFQKAVKNTTGFGFLSRKGVGFRAKKGNMGKRVLVTGVSSGLGWALTEQLLTRGDSVYGTSRRTPAQFEGHRNFHFIPMDLGELSSIGPNLEQLCRDISWLDLVILNAGALGSIADLRDVTVGEMKHLMNINVWSNKVLLDWLFQRGIKVAQVVAISSAVAVQPQRGWNGYALSKNALNTLMALYAAEVKEVHFSSISPGVIDTAMQDYVTNLTSDTRFFTVEMLKLMKGTPQMPPPEIAAGRILTACETVTRLPSGGFADLEDLAKICAPDPQSRLQEIVQRRRAAR